jgi:hypothetical protein
MTPVSFWLMIASSATAVLPVPRSPMISSRWPRPIGIIESIALMPVCIGSPTGCRCDDARRDDVDEATVLLRDLAATVESGCRAHRPRDRGSRADREVEHAARAPDRIALVELRPVAHDDRADVVLLEVQRERRDRLAGLRRRDLEHLARHRVRQAVNARDAVLHLQDLADFLDLQLLAVLLDLAEQHVLDLTGSKLGFRARHFSFRSRFCGAVRRGPGSAIPRHLFHPRPEHAPLRPSVHSAARQPPAGASSGSATSIRRCRIETSRRRSEPSMIRSP